MNAINYTNIVALNASRGHGGSCARREAQLTLSTSYNSDCLINLMNEIASKANLILAFKAVKRNKGAPGVDNRTVTDVANNLDIILNSYNRYCQGKYSLINYISLNYIVHRAMNLEWFSKLRLFSLSLAFGKHNSKPPYAISLVRWCERESL